MHTQLIILVFIFKNMILLFYLTLLNWILFIVLITYYIINPTQTYLNHLSVYFPSFQKHCLLEAFNKLPHIQFHWFLDAVESIRTEKNITYYPINQALFNKSLLSCHGLITGGGFETPSEALYLGKKLISIPIKNHYEQQCNAAAVKKLGVKVLQDIGDDFSEIIERWFNEGNNNPRIEANNITETLEFLFDTYPNKQKMGNEVVLSSI